MAEQTDPRSPPDSLPTDLVTPLPSGARRHGDSAQEELTAAGQRRVNIIWESTQAFIAAAVVLANMIVGVYDGLVSPQQRTEFPVILSSSLFLIVGFYFSRTNHSAIGGIGNKPLNPYVGR